MDCKINNVPYSETGDKEQDEKLLQPFTYILQVPGKQIRAKLALAMNYWLKIPVEKIQAVGDVVQMLHNASLLLNGQIVSDKLVLNVAEIEDFLYEVRGTLKIHFGKIVPSFDSKFYTKQFLDDIQDNSILRRGIPVAHSIFGVASTINAANYVLFIALERVLALNHPEATQVYTEQLLELHRGQGIEIYWRDNFICPTESEYRHMTMKKTGGLFNLAVRLMQLFSDCKEDFSLLTGILGLYFQIRDDYCNLSMKEYTENKSFCEDLSEGKFSFPIIHAIQSHPEDNQVMNILRKRTNDIEVKKYCVTLLEKFGSFAYTRTVLEDLYNQARKEVDRLGGNELFVNFLDDLHSWLKNPVSTEVDMAEINLSA